MLYVSFRMNDKNDTVFGRVPYRPADGWTAENSRIFADPLFSEVAMTQYVRAHTNISVPRIIHHSVDSGVVGLRTLMTKVDGVALSSI